MLPFRSGRPPGRGLSLALFILLVLVCSSIFAQPPQPNPALAPGSLPVPIGHEVKGIVLPDYDPEGRLRARFEAATARRIDEAHIQFTGLKMTMFDPETAAPDLSVEIPLSTLDLNTRVITSTARTTIARADFAIAGDTMEFDTAARRGRLTGNVKMVISAELPLRREQSE